MEQSDVVEYLSQKELETIVSSCGDMSYEEIMKAIDWALMTRIDSTVLDLVVAGMLNITIGENGELVFTFKNGKANKFLNMEVLHGTDAKSHQPA